VESERRDEDEYDDESDSDFESEVREQDRPRSNEESVPGAKRPRSDTYPAPRRMKSRLDMHCPPQTSSERSLTPVNLSTGARKPSRPPMSTVSSSTREDQIPPANRRVFELAKSFLASLVFTKVPWPATSEAEFDLCDIAWEEALESMSMQMRAVGALKPDEDVHQRPEGPSFNMDAVTRGVVSHLVRSPDSCSLTLAQLRSKISATRGRLVSMARTLVVSLYNLKTGSVLECKLQVAALLHEDSWMGTWRESVDGSPRIVAWYTRPELTALIFAQFFSSPQHLGRQAHLSKFWEKRVTPELLALTAASLQCALTDYETGQKKTPPNDFKREIYAGTTPGFF
jgi:hypothetical protein